jgi:hypothetical protein
MNRVTLKYAFKTYIAIALIAGLTIPGYCFADLPEVSAELQRVMRDYLNRPNSTIGGDSQLIDELAALANQGDPVAAYLYAIQIEATDPETSKKMLSYASSKGCIAAGTILGTQLMASTESSETGLKLMHESAYLGDPLAQLGLAGHYLKLDEPIQAYAWFKLAYKEFSIHPLMKATLDTQSELLEKPLSAAQKKSAKLHFQKLATQVKPMSNHVCASSTIAIMHAPPQSSPKSAQEAIKQDNQVQPVSPNWKLFDHVNLVTDSVKFKQFKSSFSSDQSILVIISASWNIGQYEIEHWVNSDPQLQQALNACNLIVGDVTANQDLRSQFEGDKRSVPVFALYKNAIDELPQKVRLTNFQTAQEFKQFIEEACVRRQPID